MTWDYTHGHTRCRHQIPSGPVHIGDTTVIPVSVVRDLGVYIDCCVTMSAHVTATVRACFAALRMIRSVRRSLPRHALLTLVRALVVRKVDYCNSVLAGLPTASITQLKQPYCISMIILSMPLDHRSCLVFASLIFLPLLTPSTITS